MWIHEEGRPRIVAVMNRMIASTGVTRRHTYTQFEKMVGQAEAEAALGRYYREQESARAA